jgi:hypothetical protein
MLVPLVIALTVATFLGGWIAIYPSANDHKNIGYVLWKAGLYRMNLNIATETMVGDPNRDKLVVGKTEAELQRRFGFLLEPSQASEYLRSCYLGSSWKSQKVLFLRNSSWMVIFSGDRATDLVLVKGC